MSAVDGARHGPDIRAMMGAMSAFVRTLLRNETQLGSSSVLLCGTLAALLGCSIDNRNVQNDPPNPGVSGPEGATGDMSEVSLGGAQGAAGGGSSPAGSAGSTSGGAPEASASGSAPLPVGPGSGSDGINPVQPCTAGAQRCQQGTLQLCNDAGMWAPLGMTCGECVPDASECAGATLRVCSSVGVWIDRLQCAGSQPLCQAATSKCVCDESSCPLGQICSSETFTCVEQVTDCPVPSPIPISDDIDHGFISVRFDAATNSADVRIQNINTGVLFFAAVVCNGADNCVVLNEGATIVLNPRATLDVTIPNTSIEGGELAMLNNYPESAVAGFAYVAWGTGPANSELETLTNSDDEDWRPGQRIQIAPGDTGFVSTGNSNEAAGYSSCNPLRSSL